MNCDGSCCRFAPMTRSEFKRIRRKYPKLDVKGTLITFGDKTEVIVVKDRLSGRCAFLNDDDTRCRVYEDRPRLCRLYGSDPIAPCMRCNPMRYAGVMKLRDVFKKSELPGHDG